MSFWPRERRQHLLIAYAASGAAGSFAGVRARDMRREASAVFFAQRREADEACFTPGSAARCAAPPYNGVVHPAGGE